MPLEEADLKHLWDMLGAAERAVSFVEGLSEPSYMRDIKTQHATERAIEIIGEAARRVTAEARRQVPDVAWGAIVGVRHILAHEYGEVDREKIWRIATTHIPGLIRILRPLLDANPPAPEAGIDPAEPA